MDLQTVKSWERKNHSLVLRFEKGKAIITFVEKDVIRFRYTDSSEWNCEEDLVVHVTVNNFDFQLDVRENEIELSTGELRAELQLNSIAIAIAIINKNEITINGRCAAVSLKEGWNEILVKTAVQCEKPYSGREYGFNIRVVDQEGLPVKDLLYLS